MLMKPERTPERLAKNERLCRIAPVQPVEEGLPEPLPEEPFWIGLRDRQRRPARISDEVAVLMERKYDPTRHAAFAGEEADAEQLGGFHRYPMFLDHRMRRHHVLQNEIGRA